MLVIRKEIIIAVCLQVAEVSTMLKQRSGLNISIILRAFKVIHTSVGDTINILNSMYC